MRGKRGHTIGHIFSQECEEGIARAMNASAMGMELNGFFSRSLHDACG